MPSAANTPHTPQGESGSGLLRLAVTVTLVLAIICAGFSAAGALLVLLFYLRWELPAEAGFLFRLSVKTGAFSVIAAVSGYALLRLGYRSPPRERAPTGPALPFRLLSGETLCLALVFLAILFSVFPNLSTYPHAEPDEIHHLIVARNLAQYGVYGSGNPQFGFIPFDPYDSVGPPVIVPVAAAFRLAGTTLLAGRSVMAVYFVLLCVALYALARPALGPAAAIGGLALLLAARGSVYLGRTLYGEAPALFFCATALLLWRIALRRERGHLFWGLLAGSAAGAAVLCKSFMLVLLWPLAGACLIDLMTARSLTWRAVLVPAAGALTVLGSWGLLSTALSGGETLPAVDKVSVYQHNLLFGIGSCGTGVRFLFQDPITLIAAICSMTIFLSNVFRYRYDLPTLVLFISVPFLFYWWVFFTPCRIYRYLWYALALGALFTGPLLTALGKTAWTPGPRLRRFAAMGLLALALVPYAKRLDWETGRVHFGDEMQDDRELAAYLAKLPMDCRVATSHWPLAKAMDFLADRPIPRLPGSFSGAESYDIVVGVADFPYHTTVESTQIIRFGPYIVYEIE